MNTKNEFPLNIRDVGPHPDAKRLTGTNGNGLPSGVHTGGAWLWEGEVWKPLDARPYLNCPCHYPTDELECLELMAGEPLFPRNWRREERNGRAFVVRDEAYLIPDDMPHKELDVEQILMIERAVRNLNRKHWEIGDEIALAMDRKTYELFLYDLSNAHPQNGRGCYAADEEWRVTRFFEACGLDFLVALRNNAHQVAVDLVISDLDAYRTGYDHVYASFNRPVSLLWASIPGDPILRHEAAASWRDATPHTWVLTREPLPEDVLKRYELKWGWNPIHERRRDND